MEIKSAFYNNNQLFYRITGKGDPVILLHGFGEDGSIWDNQVEFLHDQCTLIIPDLPGSGKSPMLIKDGAGLEDYAACVKAVITAECIDRCIMVGHSMGGYIMLAFAERYPDILIAGGLFHSSAYADDPDKKATRRKSIEFIKSNGPQPFLETSIPGLFYDSDKSQYDIELLLQKGNNFSGETLIQYYEAMIARPDRTLFLEDIPFPLLMIMGAHDKAVPLKQGLEQSRIPGRSYIHILRNSAHMGMLEEAGKSNRILADFLHLNWAK